jgi:LysM repeat protein
MAKTHKVVWGDTLTALAKEYSTTVDKLVQWNNISNPDYIVVGQILYVDGPNTSQDPIVCTDRVKFRAVGYVTTNPDNLYFEWSIDAKYVKEYQVEKNYYIKTSAGEKKGPVTNETVTTKYYFWENVPDGATRCYVRVKPVSKTKKTTSGETTYFNGVWRKSNEFNLSEDAPPSPPPNAPNVSIRGNTLTTSYTGLGDLNGTSIYFEVYQDNNPKVYRHSDSDGEQIIFGGAGVTFKNIESGHEYKARAKTLRGKFASTWSAYSNAHGTIPSATSGFTSCKAASETSVYLAWPAADSAKSYEIEYATERRYLDGSNQTNTVTTETTTYEIGGLDPGKTYYFRVRSVNDNGKSGWSGIKSVTLGKAPSSPTTWSSTTTAVTGEKVKLFWVHNSADGSDQTGARVEVDVGGTVQTYALTTATEYEISTYEYTEGTSIKWRVQTKGVTSKYSEWSVQRVVQVYSPPELSVSLTDGNGEPLTTLTQFPIRLIAHAGPATQTPLSYHVTVMSAAEEAYETVDDIGNVKMVTPGSEVYSEHFDISGDLDIEISAGDIDLENTVPYKVTCVVAMDSGLMAELSSTFNVDWDTDYYDPVAEVSIDMNEWCTYIRPYCHDVDGNLAENITMSVYRRNFDGGFTEIATSIPNTMYHRVVDPHPALDYARYRVVAKSMTTGGISYVDIPGYPVGCKSVIIQWDEEYHSFVADDDDIFVNPPMASTMLVLPYNIDISPRYNPDVELVEYIGREHPVSYYGTQRGETDTWSVDIDKKDVETIHKLRKLAKWPGNVYVREPSGTGYWAHVKVSFSLTHKELTVPVTLDITRVEGGA